MQEHRLDELGERCTKLLEELERQSLARQLEAKNAIQTELEAMKSEDKILVLTDEEERLLRSFRAFKARSRPGAVFKWQTHPEAGIIQPQEQALIRDPQEVSE